MKYQHIFLRGQKSKQFLFEKIKVTTRNYKSQSQINF